MGEGGQNGNPSHESECPLGKLAVLRLKLRGGFGNWRNDLENGHFCQLAI
jgi:hypothetical protein